MSKMNYILSKKKPEVGDRGFIIGNRFIKTKENMNENIDYGTDISNCVLYLPLVKNEVKAYTGQDLSYTGNLQYGKEDKVYGAYFDGNSYISLTDDGLPNTYRTVSCWVKPDDSLVDKVLGTVLFWGKFNVERGMQFLGASNYQYVMFSHTGSGWGFWNDTTSVQGKWYHIFYTFGQYDFYFYLNNVQVFHQYWDNGQSQNGGICYVGKELGNFNQFTNVNYKGWIRSIRVFNKVLSSEERTLLFN